LKQYKEKELGQVESIYVPPLFLSRLPSFASFISILNSPCLQQLIYFCEQDCCLLGYDAVLLPGGSIVNVQPMHPWREEAKPNPSVQRMDKLEERFPTLPSIPTSGWSWKMLKEYRDKHVRAGTDHCNNPKLGRWVRLTPPKAPPPKGSRVVATAGPAKLLDQLQF
jgi:hypothetical protein